MKLLLDTNICIYVIKNKPPGVRENLNKYRPGDIAISVITVAELWYGVTKSKAIEKNRDALHAFLIPFEILSYDEQAAYAYGKIRTSLEKTGTPIGSLDLLIAAQAIAHNLVLVSNNLREFSRIPNLQSKNWV